LTAHARALTEAYLARIEAVDRSATPEVVIELNPDALAIAAALDASEPRRARVDRCTASRADQDNIDTADRIAHLRRFAGAAGIDRPA